VEVEWETHPQRRKSHVAKGDYLGEFEQVVLLALARLSDDAHGTLIRGEIADRTGREVTIGSLYSALDRMERKGYVSSRLGDPTPERGGRAKRHYRLELPGLHALNRSREMHERLWEGLELDPERFVT
jgi:DNA-binding PadR family transcriptional regulator